MATEGTAGIADTVISVGRDYMNMETAMVRSEFHEEFEVTFHGPSVDDHSISARSAHDLGESMIALGNLVGIANEKLHGVDFKGELLIKAPRPGSFRVVFQYIADSLTSLFENDQDGVIKLLTGSGGLLRLFCLYRKLRGKTR